MKEENETNNGGQIKINFLGDSITMGSKLRKIIEQRFTTLLEKNLKIKALNFGISGSRIAKIDSDEIECFIDRIHPLSKTVNFTFIFGGINDFKNGTILGDKNSEEISTFYGALKFLISELLKIFSNDKLCFILPLPTRRKSPINESLSSYCNVIKELCTENNIDFLDLSNEFNNKKELLADGLHPNEKGHELLAKEIEKYIIKRGIMNF